MDKKRVTIHSEEDVLGLLNRALEHEWAVSFEYLIHAYSMPKGTFFYVDPILKTKTDVRRQTIQIGIDEMYHSLQLGLVIKQRGGIPSFRTDRIIRYPRVIDNLKRDKETEDTVIALYQGTEFSGDVFPKEHNMILNISYDEVRHSSQFNAMIQSMEKGEAAEATCFSPDPESAGNRDNSRLHDIMRMENELMHRYLKYTIQFSEHQDLSQRLFKNAIDHMRHWDKNAGILIKWGDVIRMENTQTGEKGEEVTTRAMPDMYPGEERIDSLETLGPSEETLIEKYEELISGLPEGEIKDELLLHQSLDREHSFTQQNLLKNALRFKKLL